LGAGAAKRDRLRSALSFAPRLVALDEGAHRALDLGFLPDLVVGDMDSIRPSDLNQIPSERIKVVSEQESTDFWKCLTHVAAPFAVALGVFGSRLDHGLAALNCLARFDDYPLVAIAGKDIVFLCPSQLTMSLPVGTRLSLFPLVEMTGEAHGLNWPIDGLTFSPLGRIGTSNRTILPEVTLSFSAPAMLVILPARHLSEALRALTAR